MEEGTAIGDPGAVLLEVGAAAEAEVAAGEKHRDFANDASRSVDIVRNYVAFNANLRTIANT